jgi:hypothetical protein
VNDSSTPRHRFARVETEEVEDKGRDESSWLEKNKVMVTVVAAATLIILIIVLVIVSRRKGGDVSPGGLVGGGGEMSPLGGGAIPAYVGGNGWDSASNYASMPQAHHPMQYY